MYADSLTDLNNVTVKRLSMLNARNSRLAQQAEKQLTVVIKKHQRHGSSSLALEGALPGRIAHGAGDVELGKQSAVQGGGAGADVGEG